MNRGLTIGLVLLAAAMQGMAQPRSSIGDTTVNAKLLHVGYQFQAPFGDMADRFGTNSNLGTSLMFKMRGNLLFSVDASILFGGNIREDTIIDNLLTSQGFLLGANGYATSAILYERGYAFTARVGKLFPLESINPNSGINTLVGAGFLQHKIKISDPDGALPYLDKEYAKGYDRLTNGLALVQYVGFLFLDKKKRYNFNVGLEFTEAFTQNRRNWNFDEMRRDDNKRVDLLIGIKASWILPFYGKGEQRFYMN